MTLGHNRSASLQRSDELSGGHDRMSKRWCIQLVSGVHPVGAECCRCVPDEGHSVPEFSRKPARPFDARIGQKAHDDHVDDPMLLEEQVEIRIRESAGSEMLLGDHVARLRHKVRVPLATPGAFRKRFGSR